MARKKHYILYDTAEKKEYPPMGQKEIAGLIGCSDTSVYVAAMDGHLIRRRWSVKELPDEDGESQGNPWEVFKEVFSLEWDRARKRLLR